MIPAREFMQRGFHLHQHPYHTTIYILIAVVVLLFVYYQLHTSISRVRKNLRERAKITQQEWLEYLGRLSRAEIAANKAKQDSDSAAGMANAARALAEGADNLSKDADRRLALETSRVNGELSALRGKHAELLIVAGKITEIETLLLVNKKPLGEDLELSNTLDEIRDNLRTSLEDFGNRISAVEVSVDELQNAPKPAKRKR